jgi:Asp-tRNA(Asn)/Glu-tRNA(Gln) amidotransferase A subunit family amidase
VEHYFQRIDAVNGRLNAVVSADREASLAAADDADRGRREGRRAPLLGLPVTVKDALEVRGLVSSGGSYAREGFVPSTDATVAARLRAAGAVILGKTNVPEYCWSIETDNVIYGRTSNPFDDERTPGGSSGGEAAILGADASAVGLGSDGGASIRVPAHYCGVVGLRPTAGLVPETGHWPASRSTGLLDVVCVGPLGRYVEDLALLLPVIAGPDGVDPFAVPVPLDDWRTVDVGRLRVGFYTYDGFARATAATEQAVEGASAVLSEAGCEVVEATLPPVNDATELFFGVMAADGGAQARADLAPAGGRHRRQLNELLESLRPLALDAAGLFELWRRVFAFRERVRRFVAGYDVVLSPVTTAPAPPHGAWTEEGASVESYNALNYTHVYSLAGLPAASLPVTAEAGLPVGIQIAGRPFHDHVVLAAAEALEKALGGFHAARGRGETL